MVDKKSVKEALTTLQEHKKKFVQTVELIVSLKDIDVKRTDQQVDFYTTLNHDRGKEVKICALVGPELADEAKKVFDRTILQSEFEKVASDKREIKKLASEYEYFVAQANIMGQVASAFGRVLGPRGKMPNPKAGCVVPPKTALQPIYDRLLRTVRVRNKGTAMIQVAVGKEDQESEHVVDNVLHVYEGLVHNLPQDVNNVKTVYLKLTMSPVVKVD
ncbi:MAG: hypothetical protein ACOCWQ_02165 [Nanoarchaeota archaeon]